MTLITTTDALQQLCDLCTNQPYIALDTEFIRENTWFPQLCLIQVAFEEHVYLIDPLAPQIDLNPFYHQVLLNESVLKIFHSARQDIEIFLNHTKEIIRPIFDTQVAAMVCGYGDSVSYENLVKSILNKNLNKQHRYSHWAHRPLTVGQLEYAALDVTYLGPLYENLKKRLQENQRELWLKEELTLLANPLVYRTHPTEMWKKLKPRTSDRKFLNILKHLAAWREQKAMSVNKPRAKIVKDEVLLEVATLTPSSANDFKKIRSLGHQSLHKNDMEEMLQVVQEALQKPEEEWPEPLEKDEHLNSNKKPVLELLKVLLQERCQHYGVAERLVATKDELVCFIKGKHEDLPLLSGWRFEVFGKQALDLLQGKLALKLKRNKIELMNL
jgi:ribonuclease D